MSKHKKNRRRAALKTCDPNLCDHCMYLGDGDFVCDLHCYGWREKRLHDFYLAMAKEHRRMREFYEMDDLYPERYKLKEKGIDIEKWQEEVLRDDP